MHRPSSCYVAALVSLYKSSIGPPWGYFVSLHLTLGTIWVCDPCPRCSARPSSALQVLYQMRKKKIVIVRFANLWWDNRIRKEFCAASQTVAIVQMRLYSFTHWVSSDSVSPSSSRFVLRRMALFIKIASRKSLWLNRVKQVMRKICPTGVKQNLWNAMFGKVWNILAQNLTICIFFTGVL